MSIEAMVRTRLEAELGRIFGAMLEAQAGIAERDQTIAELRAQLALAQDELQKGVE